MKLPKSITTVTLFSKMVALILFGAMPILAFYFGVKYQQAVDEIVNSNISISSNSAK